MSINLEVEAQASRHGDTSFFDVVFVKINGKQHYFWRAVDQDGGVLALARGLRINNEIMAV